LRPGDTDFFGSPITKTFSIRQPFYATFNEIEHYLIVDRLSQSQDYTPIASIVDTYQVLANLATRGGCLDHDKSGYIPRYTFYWNKVAMWKRLAGEGVTIP
jgi:hypothetical protein